MSTSTKPLIVVTGATGAQGGSVVKFLLKDGGFSIRAVTRNVDSAKAKELAAIKGVQVVQANFDDPASVLKAFEGAYGVFGVTNYWDPVPEGTKIDAGERETKQGKTLVDAAKKAGVKHFVWSTLDHTKGTNAEVHHCDSKAAVDDYLKASGVPRTSVYTVFYFENLQSFFQLTKGADGTLEANWPILQTDGPLGGYAVADTGAWVLESLKKPEEWIGKDIRVISEIITPRDIVKAYSELSGKQIKLHEVSAEAFAGMKNVPGLEELWANMNWFYVNKGCPDRDFAVTKQVYPGVLSFRAWAEMNLDSLIPK